MEPAQSIKKNVQRVSMNDFILNNALNFDVNPKISSISNTIFTKGAEFCFGLPSHNVVCLAKHLHGIKIFIIDNNESKIITEHTIHGNSDDISIKEVCVFDKSSLRLYVGLDKKIYSFSFKGNTIRTIKEFVIESDYKERVTTLRYEDKKDAKGFWIITNKNQLYFIEIKEQTGFSELDKFWKIKFYLKKENKVLENTIIEAAKNEDGSLYVLTKEALFRFTSISSKIFLTEYINFSASLLNGKIYVQNDIIVVVADNKEGLIALLFNKNDFKQNSSFWAFQNKKFATLGSVEYFDKALYIADKESGGIQKINLFIDDNGPVFNSDPYWTLALTEKQNVVSEMLISDSHLFCITKNENESHKLKSFSSFDGIMELCISIPTPKQKQKLFLPNDKSLYLLSNEGTVIVHGKENT